MTERELSPLEALLTGKLVAPTPASEPAKPRRRADQGRIKELHEMVLNRDRRLNGRSQREFEHQLELDWVDISAVFGEYPEVMRFNQHSRLWSIHPDAES